MSKFLILGWIFCVNYWILRGKVVEANKLFACLIFFLGISQAHIRIIGISLHVSNISGISQAYNHAYWHISGISHVLSVILRYILGVSQHISAKTQTSKSLFSHGIITGHWNIRCLCRLLLVCFKINCFFQKLVIVGYQMRWP